MGGAWNAHLSGGHVEECVWAASGGQRHGPHVDGPVSTATVDRRTHSHKYHKTFVNIIQMSNQSTRQLLETDPFSEDMFNAFKKI